MKYLISQNSYKYLRPTISGFKDIGIRKKQFGTKNQFRYDYFNDT